MTPRPTVIVFVRAPRLGAVKRRLARDVGDKAALAFHRGATAALLGRLAGRRWRVVLCVTPDRYARRGRFWPARPARLAQGAGDIGRRMARGLEACRGPAVLVGSDIPALGAAEVATAFAALGAHDLVFGPAADGGFWLVGARDTRRVRPLFRGVRWSGPHALADTLANAPAPWRVALLAPLADVDDGAALARLTRRRGAP